GLGRTLRFRLTRRRLRRSCRRGRLGRGRWGWLTLGLRSRRLLLVEATAAAPARLIGGLRGDLRARLGGGLGGEAVRSPVGGPTIEATFGGPTIEATGGGPTIEATVGAPTIETTVGGPTIETTVGGATIETPLVLGRVRLGRDVDDGALLGAFRAVVPDV